MAPTCITHWSWDGTSVGAAPSFCLLFLSDLLLSQVAAVPSFSPHMALLLLVVVGVAGVVAVWLGGTGELISSLCGGFSSVHVSRHVRLGCDLLDLPENSDYA